MKKIIGSFLVGVAVVIVLFLSGFQSTRAYQTFPNNPTWPNADPHYIIDTSYSSQGPNWAAKANDAANDWNLLTQSNLRFKATGGSGNNRITGGVDTCHPTPTPPAIARTGMNFNGTMTQITNFTVQINLNCSYPFYDGSQGPSIPPNYFDLRSVVEHELGHGLGLCHTSVLGAMMNGISAGQTINRKKDDNQGNRFLYQPGYTGPTPVGHAC